MRNDSGRSGRIRATASAILLFAAALFASGPGPLRDQSTIARDSQPAFPGEAEVKALAEAYPDRVTATAFREGDGGVAYPGDWALQLDGLWYAWAQGRLLPESESSRWNDYPELRFYRYPLTLPPLPQLSEEEAEELLGHVRQMRDNPPKGNEQFLNQLFQARTLDETWQRIVQVKFAGHPVKVHERIARLLAEIGQEIQQLAQSDAEVASFLKNLQTVGGFNWRDIAGTTARSYHSYGLAVDLIPKRYRGHPYWQWALDQGVTRWWEIPYEKRWMIPTPIVQAFERHGFIWGGKWRFFDTMHFEYRPEVLLLAIP